jgi:hypothetical protein
MLPMAFRPEGTCNAQLQVLRCADWSWQQQLAMELLVLQQLQLTRLRSCVQMFSVQQGTNIGHKCHRVRHGQQVDR